MIIQFWQPSLERGNGKRIVLTFGVGLIGTAISHSIDKRISAKSQEFPFSWSHADDRSEQINRLLAFLRNKFGKSCEAEIDVVWAAGRAGFSDSEKVFEAEQGAFQSVLQLVMILHRESYTSRLTFHLISSAGGLFEGQRKVDKHSTVSSLRAYGDAKLKIENKVKILDESIAVQIYRPSSVYGYSGKKGRVGLVVAMLTSIVQNSTVKIYAQPDTLRDYVFVSDIGRFIAQNILNWNGFSQTHLLASGKPTSTLELIQHVERIMRRRVSVQFELNADNIESNTFNPYALPENWMSTSLETGIWMTANNIRNALHIS